jgi:hypothetical protein
MTTRSALIARRQLNPHEEARALKAMLARGLSEDGAAQALGWPRARVSARMRLLELPERAQQMVGAGEVSLSCVDVLRQIGEVSRPIQALVVQYLDHDDTAWARDRLEGEPGWVIGQAIQAIGTSRTSAEYMIGFGPRDIAELNLGKVAGQRTAEVNKLFKELNPYAYASQLVRFIDAEIDQARAARVPDRVRARGADHHRPQAVPRAGQARAEACRAGIPRQGERRQGGQGGGAQARRCQARGPVRAG